MWCPEKRGHKTKGLCRVKESCEHSSDNHGYPRLWVGNQDADDSRHVWTFIGKVWEIRSRSNVDIKAVTAYLQTATTSQKKMMVQVVRSSGGNELSPRRESLGVARQTLRRWILAAEIGLLGVIIRWLPFKATLRCDGKATKASPERNWRPWYKMPSWMRQQIRDGPQPAQIENIKR